MENFGTVADAVAARLRAMIGSGELAPGEPIVIEAAAARLAVSAQPVREALKTLESEGRVQHHPHRGARVLELTIEDLAELDAIRSLIEDAELRESVELLGPAEVDRLQVLAAQLDAVDATATAESLMELHTEFIGLLHAAAPNRRLRRLVETVRAATDPYRHRYFRDPVARAEFVAMHRAIADAVRAGDADGVLHLVQEQRRLAFAALRDSGAIRPAGRSGQQPIAADRGLDD